MAKKLQKICILSGPREIPRVDALRAQTGIKYHRSLDDKVPFRILGAGPDLLEAIANFSLYEAEQIDEKEYFERMHDLNHHLSLYQTLAETGEEVGIVTSSVTLVQNVLHGFQEEQDGRYAIITEPWHYKKFKTVEKVLKQKGKISQELEFFNVDSPDIRYYSFLQKLASFGKTSWELMRV